MMGIEKHLTEFKTLLGDISKQLGEVVKLLKEIRDGQLPSNYSVTIKDNTTWTGQEGQE